MRRACFARVEELRAARAAREERRIPVFTEKTDSPLLPAAPGVSFATMNSDHNPDVRFPMVNLLKENDACRRKYGEAGRKDGRAGRAKGAMGEAMTESGGDARENVRDER